MKNRRRDKERKVRVVNEKKKANRAYVFASNKNVKPKEKDYDDAIFIDEDLNEIDLTGFWRPPEK